MRHGSIGVGHHPSLGAQCMHLRREGLGARTVAELARHPRIQQLVQIQIDRLNADLASYEAIRRFAIAPLEFTEASGDLTPTLKLRRRDVATRHAALIDALYK